MKTKKIVAALLAGTLAATAVVSVSAANLTNENPDGSTEVTAKIEGVGPGNVSYVITIPEKVDFGTLTQPETDTDSYKYVNDSVVATEINFTSGAVSVYAKSSSSDGVFSLAQKNVESPFIIPYDIYTALITTDAEVGDNVPVNQTDPSAKGYHITTFASNAQGQAQDITLALNQKVLYGKDLDTIAGDYSGTIVFHSEWKGTL